jgi:hypothetical protein
MKIAAQKLMVWLVLLTAVTACAQLGLEEAKTFEDRLAYAYSQNAAARTSAAQALQSGAISKADADQVLKATDGVRTALDEARKFQGLGDTSTALSKLQVATAALTQVQALLKSRGIK